MKKMLLTRALPSTLLAVALMSAPATGPAGAALPRPAVPPAPGAGSRTTTLDQLPDSANPIRFQSHEGQFATTFPTGCARLRTRVNTGDDGKVDPDHCLVFATCDRYEKQGEGCQVVARLGSLGELRGEAAAEQVRAEVGKLLAEFAVHPVRQAPVSRDFGNQGRVDGVDVQAQAKSGSGDVWIRGLVRDRDMYLLVAWKTDGGLFADPEYRRFFDDFVPWAE